MRVLDVAESLNVVRGVAPLARHFVARKVDEARVFAKKAGFPVVLKAVSSGIVHKTEAGAVRIVHSEPDLARQFVLLKRLAPKVLVQEFVRGVEFIVGLKKDPVFGHVVLAGVGGVYVEVYKDVSFRVCPVDEAEAWRLLDDLQGSAVLSGVRGKKLKSELLVDAIVKLSELPKKQPRIAELDINPFILNDREGKVVDARVVLEQGLC